MPAAKQTKIFVISSPLAAPTIPRTEVASQHRPGAAVPLQVPIPFETVSIGQPLIDSETGWSRLPIAVRRARQGSWESLRRNWQRFSPLQLTRMMPATREYYTNLYSLIDSLESADQEEDGDISRTQSQELGRASMLIYGSFVANLMVFTVKVSVAISSGALVVYASALDSFLDLLSGSILSLTAWLMSKPAPYKYPVGKLRMEPLGVIIFATIMGTCYAQVILEACARLLMPSEIVCDISVLVLLGCIVGCKAVLYMICRIALAVMKQKSVALEAQSEDHFNDCGTNLLSAAGTFLASSSFSRLCGLQSSTALYFVDPVTAALFSVYVIYSWLRIAWKNILSLVGKTAEPELIQRITYLAMVHCSEIIAVDTVRCYSSGSTHIAEVDVVLPTEMVNRQVHDVAESLQIRIESLSEIQRCFVHIDWETTHKPEHKGT